MARRDSLRIPPTHPVLASPSESPVGPLLACIREQLEILGIGWEGTALAAASLSRHDVSVVLGRVECVTSSHGQSGARCWYELARDCEQHLRALEERLRAREATVPDMSEDEHRRLEPL